MSKLPRYYRGYILIRVRELGSEWKVVDKVKNLKSKDEDEDWKVSYASPIYGNWDLAIEISLSKREELDKIEAYLNFDEDLSRMIEETTKLVSTKNNFEERKEERLNLYYRAYIMVRLKKIGSENLIVNNVKILKSDEEGEDWKVTYVSSVYGGWDLVIEVSFSRLVELDKVVTHLRTDRELSKMIEETSTLVGSKQNWPFEE
jgi:hypothetical protein